MRNAPRSAFPHFLAMPTRWMDNDSYGHVNNVQYYSFFDTAVNQFLVARGVLDIHADQVVGLVVDTGCSYFSSVSFPDTVHVGVRVAKLGNSSVRYELAIFLPQGMSREREALLQGQPAGFLTTPHYDGHLSMLVRLEAAPANDDDVPATIVPPTT